MINGKIYSIRTLTNENLIYIGSTKEPRLSARLSKHKSNYKEYLKGCYGYTTAFKIIELGDAYIEIWKIVKIFQGMSYYDAKVS